MNPHRTALRLVLVFSPVLSTMAAPGPASDASPAAPSANFTVASTADEPDSDLGDGLCYSNLAGDCTLRAAIQQANALPGDHVIRFGASLPTPATFTLTRLGDDGTALYGDLDITGRLSLIGAGADNTIIDGNRSVTSERVFHVMAGAVVTLTGITVQNGYHATFGGGVFNQGTLVLSATLLTNNLSSNGGGIGNTGSLTTFDGRFVTNIANNRGGGLYNEEGTASLNQSTVASNSAPYGAGIFGAPHGTVTLTESTVSGNLATVGGGGIYNTEQATLSMIGSLVTGCRTYDPSGQHGEGGGIYNSGTATLSDTTIEGSTATGWGAGIYNNTNALLTLNQDSLVSGNTTAGWGGGLYNTGGSTLIRDTAISDNIAQHGGGGGILNSGGPLTLSRSAVTGNSSYYNGGGIYNLDPLMVSNSTISGNRSLEEGGGIYSLDTLDLSNTTVAGNTADSDDNGTETGGGLVSPYSFTMRNSVISGNVHLESGSRVPDDCVGKLTSHGYNLIEDTGGCALSGMTGSDKYGLSALLQPLTGNGGPTWTHALSPNSPAVDAGNPAGCSDDANVLFMTDQRGAPRPSGLRCDMGAYELESTVATLTPTATATRTPTAPTATGTITTSPVPTLTRTQPPVGTSTPTPPTAVATTSTPVGTPPDGATPTADARHRIYCPVVRTMASSR